LLGELDAFDAHAEHFKAKTIIPRTCIGPIATHACCDVIRLAEQLRNTIFIGQRIDGHNKRLYEFRQNLPTWPFIIE
jgi:hypothetical protein